MPTNEYKITVTSVGNGTAYADKAKALFGETVTLTATPAAVTFIGLYDGYDALQTLTCYDNELSALGITGMTDAEYTVLCGKQTSDGTAVLQLTLKIRAAQQACWNEVLKTYDDNENVTLNVI